MSRQSEIVHQMFKSQAALMRAFSVIEQLPRWPVDLQSLDGQALLREFAGRIAEEVVEAYDADRGHVAEELTDAFHFLVETCILVGMPSNEMAKWVERAPNIFDGIDALHLQVHNAIGRFRHELKMRPWKRRPVLTSVDQVHMRLRFMFTTLLSLWKAHSMDLEDLAVSFESGVRKNLSRIADGV